MSETALSDLDLRQALAQIDRTQAETRKLLAEQVKLSAEARKFEKERWMVFAAMIGGLTGGAAAVLTALKAFGVIP